MGPEYEGGFHGDGHRGEISHRVELHRLDGGNHVAHQGGGVGEEQGVAVGLAACHMANADGAGGAGPVVDDDRLLEALAQVLGQAPGKSIGLAAGGPGHDDVNFLGRPGFLGLQCRSGEQGEGGEGQQQAGQEAAGQTQPGATGRVIRVRHELLHQEVGSKGRAPAGAEGISPGQ